jgi:hypothetical protein
MAERPSRGAGLQRPCLRRCPRPHDGTILVETRHMEGDLHLVRKGHRDRLTVHGVRTPRAGPDRGRVPLLRPCGLGSVSALPTLHWRQASQRVSGEGAAQPVEDPAHADAAWVVSLGDSLRRNVTQQGQRRRCRSRRLAGLRPRRCLSP